MVDATRSSGPGAGAAQTRQIAQPDPRDRDINHLGRGYALPQMDRKRSMDELQREIQELFSDLWQVPRFSGLRAGFRPNVDCYRTKDAIIVLVELPGVDTANVDIFVAEGTLYVSGERKRPRGDGQTYQQMELDYGPFRRQIALGSDVDVE